MNIPNSYVPILAHLSETLPEVKELADQIEAGKMNQAEAMVKLIAMSSDPRVSEVLRNTVEAFLPKISETVQKSAELELFQPNPKRRARLNPLYMREIAERLQFDSDIPELRTGYLAPGTKPQVPVDTDAVNPVAIGMMLESASEHVLEEMEKHLEDMETQSEQVTLALDDLDDPDPITDMATLDSQHDNPFVAAQLINQRKDVGLIRATNLSSSDPEIYKRGRLPAPIKTVTPSGADLSLLSEDKRKKMAWRFISTTAGRRTGSPIILKLMLKEFKRLGVSIQAAPGQPIEGEFLALCDWAISVADGSGTLQSNFSPITVAAKALSRQLVEKIAPENRGDKFLVWVNTLDTIADREVGWEAYLCADEDTLQ